ncbi:MAG: YciI family protein [Phenylobacterium sp.]|nr:YciI family protein [Phenylobacterium sp.]
MLYAILAYHDENQVQAWSDDEDRALMDDLMSVHNRLVDAGRLGPAARLGATGRAVTLRGPGRGVVTDGPFAETKEALLGFYVLDAASLEEAADAARGLRLANPSAVYEIRPIALFVPGASFPLTDQGLGDVRPGSGD